ncbi:BZ3500_MvSof-1268-A1-R1_C113g00617 [Microbotryum saponariae]|uniref:BZ3500_MvSof-1268-A1-R1_C113g00617 protein n=1 Tax=Microbotryum saponariae TaxID=289078 RepID=A0A2X0KUN4_9BASI|nr:BZ3500_MvSof-1268-A1-R1_C113g00617 [Microbotryum saponariae]
MARPYTIRRIRRVLNAKAFHQHARAQGTTAARRSQELLEAVNSKALTAREREVWFKLILRFTPTRKLQHEQKHDTSPACLVCEAPGRALRRARMRHDRGRRVHDLQRLFGLPKLKAKLSEQEGAAGRSRSSRGWFGDDQQWRWRMQKHGTRMESAGGRRVVLEERMKLRAGEQEAARAVEAGSASLLMDRLAIWDDSTVARALWLRGSESREGSADTGRKSALRGLHRVLLYRA